LIASALVAACSSPSENDFFGGDPPGTSGSGGSAAGSGGSSAVSGSGGGSGTGGSAGSSGGSVSGAGGSAGTTTGGTAGSETGGTAGTGGGTAGTGGGSGGTAGGETGGTGGTATGGVAGTSAGTAGTSEAGSGGTNEAGAAGAPPTCVPEEERCDGIDNDCENGVDDGNVCPDDCVGGHFEGHDYLFCPAENSGPLGGGRTWTQARTYCVAEGMVLVHLETQAETKFVYAELAKLDLGLDAWMGATDRLEEEEWAWEGATMLDSVLFYDADSGMAVDGFFVDWREGEPNDGGSEDCGVIEDQGDGTFLWDDRSCNEQQELLVCEGEP
jgi:hypothetical protein